MTDVKRTQLYSASLTAVLWIIAAVIIFIAPLSVPQEKKDFSVVRITLSSVPRVEIPAENVSASVSAIQESLLTQNVEAVQNVRPVQSVLPPAAPPSAARNSVRQAETAAPKDLKPVPPANKADLPAVQNNAEATVSQNIPQTLAPDLTTIEIGRTVQTQPPQRKEAEWPSEAEWVTQSTKQAKDSTPVQNKTEAAEPVSQFEGTAAQLAQAADTGVQAASIGRNSLSSERASEQTTGALKRISEATYLRTGGTAGVSHETALAVAQGSDGVEIQLKDGSTRRLLDPAEPSITLSPESELLIDSSRRVLIQFRVLASGNVPAGNISFSPAALLPVPVQEEIRAQIARWRFETAQGDGQAAFQYSIKKQ